jgi:hypothetical protein
MKLNELNPTPLYDLTIPSTGKKVKYRPFFVREERALLTAYETQDESTMLNTIVSIVKGCIKPEVNLTSFDVEYIFLQIRSKSVGEISQLIFTCSECAHETNINVNITQATVNGVSSKNIIKLSENLSIKMKYPLIDDIVDIVDSDTPELNTSRAIAAVCDTIYSGDDSILVKEESTEDVIRFLEELTSKQYALLEEFVDSTPTVELPVHWKCPKCSHENKNTLSGLTNFF